MTQPRFEQLAPISREEVKRDLSSPDEEISAKALIRMALHEPDWQWAENVCLSALREPRRVVKTAALLGLGHLARIHRTLDLEIVLPRVMELLEDVEVRGTAEDTLEDIAIFVDKEEVKGQGETEEGKRKKGTA